jgi:hypothetical protein
MPNLFICVRSITTETARTAGILDVLLDSVYTETPQLSIDELRAPEKGKAALQ